MKVRVVKQENLNGEIRALMITVKPVAPEDEKNLTNFLSSLQTTKRLVLAPDYALIAGRYLYFEDIDKDYRQ